MYSFSNEMEKNAPRPLPRRKYLSEQSEDGESIASGFRSKVYSPSSTKINAGKQFQNNNYGNPMQSVQESPYEVDDINSTIQYNTRAYDNMAFSNSRIGYGSAYTQPATEVYEAKSLSGDVTDEELSLASGKYGKQYQRAAYNDTYSDRRQVQHASNVNQKSKNKQFYSYSRQNNERKNENQYDPKSRAEELTRSVENFHSRGQSFSSARHESNNRNHDERSYASQREPNNGHSISPRHRSHSNREMSRRQHSSSTPRRDQYNASPRHSVSSRASSPYHQPAFSPASTQDVGGELAPSSIGANVRVNWRGLELARLHWAAIYCRWSVVSILSDVAQKNERNGYMVVDVSGINRDDGSPLFPEDFPSVFGTIFKDNFVPCVHEKFNHKESQPSYLPSDIGDAFKLLVLCERFEAMLKKDVMKYIVHTLRNSGQNANPSDSPAYNLVKTSLEFNGRPPVDSLQERIVHRSVGLLVEMLPNSLPALQTLVSVCVEKGNQHMAVMLFRETTQNTMKMGQTVANEQTRDTIAYIESLRDGFTEKRTRNHVDVFAEMLRKGTAQLEFKSSNRAHSDTALAFEQGVILHKRGHGSSGGARVVRVNGEHLQWTKLNRKIWQPERSLHRANIISISQLSASFEPSFRIKTRDNHTIVFMAQSQESCKRCVESLVAWWSKKLSYHPSSGLTQGIARKSMSAIQDRPAPISNGKRRSESSGGRSFANMVANSVMRRRSDLERMGGTTRRRQAVPNIYRGAMEGSEYEAASVASRPNDLDQIAEVGPPAQDFGDSASQMYELNSTANENEGRVHSAVNLAFGSAEPETANAPPATIETSSGLI